MAIRREEKISLRLFDKMFDAALYLAGSSGYDAGVAVFDEYKRETAIPVDPLTDDGVQVALRAAAYLGKVKA